MISKYGAIKTDGGQRAEDKWRLTRGSFRVWRIMKSSIVRGEFSGSALCHPCDTHGHKSLNWGGIVSMLADVCWFGQRLCFVLFKGLVKQINHISLLFGTDWTGPRDWLNQNRGAGWTQDPRAPCFGSLQWKIKPTITKLITLHRYLNSICTWKTNNIIKSRSLVKVSLWLPLQDTQQHKRFKLKTSLIWTVRCLIFIP